VSISRSRAAAEQGDDLVAIDVDLQGRREGRGSTGLPGSMVALWRRQDERDERRLEDMIRSGERIRRYACCRWPLPVLRCALCELLGCQQLPVSP
jgi:hypothetical protein